MAAAGFFLQDNFHFIHFAGALALFLLALVFFMARRGAWIIEGLPPAWPLAAFALLHALNHGIEGVISYRAMLGNPGGSLSLEGAAAVFDVLSFGFLLHFGLRGLLPASLSWGRALAPFLMALWVAGFAAGLILDPARAGEWIESAQSLGEIVFALFGGLFAALVFWKVPPGRRRVAGRITALAVFAFGAVEWAEVFFRAEGVLHASLMALVAVVVGVAAVRLLSLGVGAKLAGGLLAGYAITLIVGGAGYLGFSVVEHEVARAEALEEEARALLNLQRSLERALSLSSMAFPAEEVERRLEESVRAYRQAHRGSERQEVGAFLEAARQEYQKLTAGAAGSGDVKELLERLDRYQAQHRAEVLQVRARVKEARNNIRLAILAGLGLASVGAVLFGLAFARVITVPLKILREGTAGIGRGEFHNVEISTGDELEDLAREFNAMAESLRERTSEILALNSISRKVSESLDLDQVLSATLEQVIKLMEVDAGIIYLWDPEAQILRVRAHRGLSPAYVGGVNRIRMGEGLVGTVAESGEPAVVEDVQNDPRIIRPQYVRGEGIRSVLMVPLKTKAATLGMFYVATRLLRHFTSREVELMVSVGSHVATAIENARLFEESRAQSEALDEQGRRLFLLHLTSRFLSTESDPDRLLRRLVGAATELIGARYGALAVLGDDGKVVKFLTAGISNELKERIGSPPEGRGLLGYVFREGKTLRIDDLAPHPEAAGVPLHHPVMKNLLAAPIRYQEKTLGALYLTEKEGGFTADDENILATLCVDAAVAMENAKLLEDLKNALEEVKAAQERVVRAATLSAVGELAAGSAHHLNNILAVIVGRAQILLRDAKDPALERSLRIVERAALDGAEVVRRVQQFSRTRVRSEYSPVDLNQIAGEVIEITRPRWQDEAQSQGRLIETVLDAGPVPPVSGQPSELREVVVNLILNAVDALPEGGQITLRIWADGERIFLSVADNGVGMSAEVKARAFEPFFTTKGVKSTGLGLSVTHGIIQRHGGEITVESEEGKGTTMILALPALKFGASEAKAPSNGKAHPARILLIDDEADVREALADLLALEGHTVTYATDGYQGIAKLEVGAFDLVLTDLGMPGINGWQVAEAVKSQFPQMPVVLVTGWANTLEPGEEERVDGVLTKPFQVSALRDLLGRLLPSTPPEGGGPSGNGSRAP